MEAYSANDYRFYLEHSWGTSPAQKLREKEYNKQYYEAHKSKWGVDGEGKTRDLENFVPTTDKEKEGAAKILTKDLNRLDKERAKQQYKVNEAIDRYTKMVAKANRAKTDEKHDKLNRKADEFLNSRSKDFDNLEKTNKQIEKALKDAEDIGLTVDTKDTKRLAEDISTIVAKSAINFLTVPLTGTVVVPGVKGADGTKYKVKYDKDKKNAEQDAELAKKLSGADFDGKTLNDIELGKLSNKNTDAHAKQDKKEVERLSKEAAKALSGADFDGDSTPEAVTKAVNDAKARGDEKEAKRLTNLYKEESAHKEKMANASSDKKESKYETAEWKEQARKALANAKKNDRYDINFLETVQNDDYSTQKLLIEYEKYLKNPEKYMQTH